MRRQAGCPKAGGSSHNAATMYDKYIEMEKIHEINKLWKI